MCIPFVQQNMLFWKGVSDQGACAGNFGTYYRISEQRWLRWVCAYAQTRQSLRCLHTRCMDIEKGSDQNLNIKPSWAFMRGICTYAISTEIPCTIRPAMFQLKRVLPVIRVWAFESKLLPFISDRCMTIKSSLWRMVPFLR